MLLLAQLQTNKSPVWHGAYKYGNTERRLKVLEELFAGFVSLPFDDSAAWHYGDIRHRLVTATIIS
ncbi:MAG: type II toxin-antitoxin system VapC family toxin [Planctomycetota bacterium]|nr:type II toxin-antitoxin system VapC family toxin [Planctomycetota bacterium]